MPVTISPGRMFGQHLYLEEEALELKAKILHHIRRGEDVIINLTRVQVCTPPFMDIAFGSLVKEMTPKRFHYRIHWAIKDKHMHYLVMKSIRKARLVYGVKKYVNKKPKKSTKVESE